MQKTPARNTTLSFSLPFLLSLPVMAGTNVLVVDEGVDLAHPQLAAKAFFNDAEKGGTPGLDDDNNGFIDDSAGWNNVSNDGEYFPTRVKTLFENNKERVTKLFGLYSRVESGDDTALDELRTDPIGARILSTLLGLSHGTHVAGIVARTYQKEVPFLQSFNVFTASKEDQEPSSFVHSGVTPFSNKLSRAFIKKFATLFLGTNDEPTATTAETSMFDDIHNFDKIMDETVAESNSRAERFRSYLRSHPQKVVNLSLGFSKDLYVDSLNQIWKAELHRRGMDPATQRTPAQETVLQSLADKFVEVNKAYYGKAFGEFTDTLFVVAAGNDGDPAVPTAGNNDLRPVWPSNYSVEFPNVISIAAVDDKGTITDFSDFGKTTVNIAAPGKAIKSLAPGGLEVAMSGTSMSSPYVAGLAARLRTLNPKLSAADTRKIIEKTGKKMPSLVSKCTTEAIVDPDAAASAAIASNDDNVDKSIEQTLKQRAFFKGKTLIFNDMSPAARHESARTPQFVRDMMRSLFYK